MLCSKLLCCSALVLAVCRVGPAEGSTGELARPASLAEQLHGYFGVLKKKRLDGFVRVSSEMVGRVKAALDLVVDRLPGFVEQGCYWNQSL